jgi:hypothetical protein
MFVGLPTGAGSFVFKHEDGIVAAINELRAAAAECIAPDP